MRSENFVSIVSAKLNKKGNVLEMVSRMQRAVKDIPHELIIVEDKSTDGTIYLYQKKHLLSFLIFHPLF